MRNGDSEVRVVERQVSETNRRSFLQISSSMLGIPLITTWNAGCGAESSTPKSPSDVGLPEPVESTQESPSRGSAEPASETSKATAMQIHYLEFVTKDVEGACALYSRVHGLKFGEPDASLGNARTAPLANGGMIGIRAPMHDGEKPVIRPYVLVKDIAAAVAAASAAGAEIAVPPMKLGTHGTCAIFLHHGLESALWQL